MTSNTRRPYSTIARPKVYRWVAVQIGVLLLLSAIGWWFEPLVGKSMFLGGCVAVIPSAYFAWCAFRYTGAAHGARILQSFYRGEAWNFILTAVGFSWVFLKAQPIDAYALFVTFALLKLSHVWVVKWVRV